MSNAAHRVLWTAIGLLLVAIGGIGITASYGVLPGTDPDAPLLWSGLLDLWRDTTPAGVALLVILGLLLALLGLKLLARLLLPRPQPAMHEVALGQPDRSTGDKSERTTASGLPGTTTVRGAVLARGLERDLASEPEVRRASVILTGAAARPELWIQLQIGPRARLAAIRDHVGAAVDRFTATSGLHPHRLDVTTRMVGPSSSRQVS
ncbi:hypothetical protein ACWDV4_26015 [Micromonospora sp. NPDC003197]